MNKFLTASLALTMAAMLPAAIVQAQSISEKAGVNSALGIAPKSGDFVTEVANSDMLEIQSSKLALNANDAAIKSFAQKMIDDHTATSDQLKKIANGANGLTVPATMDKTHQSKLDKLSKLQGADFVKEYKSMQVSAHKDAVSLFDRYAKNGDNEQLKSFAAATLPKLQGHLKMAQDMSK